MPEPGDRGQRQQQPAEGPGGLLRGIGQLGFGAIALNGIIGAGVFALPAIAVGRAGDFSPWVFVLCGALILPVVLAFARVASFFDDTGGPVTYAGAAFGPFAGFQAGWLSLLARAASFAANAHLMVTYAGWFWPPLLEGAWHAVAVAAVCVLLGVINIVGLRQGMAAIFALTVLKLLPLLLLVVFGITRIEPQLFTGVVPPADGLGETLLILLYAYVGFEGAVVPAGEGRNARRDIPRALLRTTLGVTLFYFLIQAVTVSVAPWIGSSSTPLAEVATILLGSAGAAVLTLGAVFSITGNLMASVLSVPRMLYAMAHIGSMPAWFGAVHPRFRTPANAIGFYTLVSVALAMTGGFVWLAAMSTAVRLLIYVMCIAALPRLQRRFGAIEGQFRLPGGLAIPALALVLCLWLMTYAPLQSWGLTAGFAALGSLVYLAVRRQAASEAWS